MDGRGEEQLAGEIWQVELKANCEAEGFEWAQEAGGDSLRVPD